MLGGLERLCGSGEEREGERFLVLDIGSGEVE